MRPSEAKFKAQMDGIMWSFFCQFVETWHERNPECSAAELIEEIRRRTNDVCEAVIEAEMRNGSTQEEATRMVSAFGC